MTGGEDELRFVYEWERGDGVSAPELAATWARLEIWVGDSCLTQVEDTTSLSARRGIYCSLYPLAEWVAFNWWMLQANVRPAGQARSVPWRRGAAWMRHHALRSAGDGFLWPDVLVLPEGAATRLVWHPDGETGPDRSIRYLTGGEALIERGRVLRALTQLVVSVLGRLKDQGVGDTALSEEWDALSATGEDEREFCLAVARLGFDPYCVDESIKTSVQASSDRLPEDMLVDFLESVTPSKIADGLSWIDRSSEAIDRTDAAPSPALKAIRSEVASLAPTTAHLPWDEGWQQARTLRGLFDLPPDAAFEMNGMIQHKRRQSSDRALQGLGGLSSSDAGVLISARRLKEPDARFARARALWHFAYGRTPQRFLLTPSHADRQRVERAFAAELLAPADGVRALLDDESGVVTPEDVEDVATRFGVSPFVVRHQVANQLSLQMA